MKGNKLISGIAVLLMAMSLCSCENKEDKEYIECYLPLCVWQDNAEVTVHKQMMSVAGDWKDYAMSAIERYKSKCRQDDSDRFNALSLFGLGPLYSSNREERESNIEKYTEHFETVLDDLKSAMYAALWSQDPRPAESIPSGTALAKYVLGTPDKPANISKEEMQKIGNALVQQVVVIYPDIDLPYITSCKYDFKEKYWVVTFLVENTQYVRVIKVGKEKQYRYTHDLLNEDYKVLELR